MRKNSPTRRPAPCRGAAFTLIELLTVIAIIGLLAALLVPLAGRARRAAQSAASLSNLRQLAAANLAYATDHSGRFVPAMTLDNRRRWHGARASTAAPFDPTKGFLAPYLGQSGTVKICPVFETMDRIAPDDPANFENGAGGYGYNMAYLGGLLRNDEAGYLTAPVPQHRVPNPSRTVMFTSAAFAKKKGVQEYAFTEPYEALTPTFAPAGYRLTASTHFRHDGRAHVAWCDGHVSGERRNDEAAGGSSGRTDVGWFGPTDANGYWNPFYPAWTP